MEYELAVHLLSRLDSIGSNTKSGKLNPVLLVYVLLIHLGAKLGNYDQPSVFSNS
jgi:hypothetical protein